MKFGILPILLLFSCNFVNAAEEAEASDDKFTRLLQNDRECGERIGVFTVDDVVALGGLMLQPYYATGSGDFTAATEVIFNPAKFKVAVYKLCSSCSDIDQWYLALDKFMPVYHTETYCNFNSSTYNTQTSFLVMVPVDENEDILKGVNLRGFVSLRPSRIALEAAPTVAFPGDMASFIQDATDNFDSRRIQHFLEDMMPPMAAAASGSISIMPDYLGYGESAATANRTVFYPAAYELASITAFFGTEKWLQESTQYCTFLDTFKVTVQGLEDGANAAMFVSQLLQQHERTRTPRGVRAIKVFATGILDLETFWAKTASVLADGSASQDELARRHELLLLSLYTFSGRLTAIPDSPDGVTIKGSAVAASYEGAILDRFNYPPNETVSLPISDSTQMFDQSLLQFIGTLDQLNYTTPCAELLNTSVPTDNFVEICESIRGSSGWNPLEENLGPFWFHPLASCYGDNDAIISTDQWASVGVENVKSKLENLYERYIGPDPEESPELQVENANNHFQVNMLCNIHPLLYYNLEAFTPADPEDKPNLNSPLSSDQSQLCQDPNVGLVTDPPTTCDDEGNCEPIGDNGQDNNGTGGNNQDGSQDGNGDGDGNQDGNGNQDGDGNQDGNGNDGGGSNTNSDNGDGSAATAAFVNIPTIVVSVFVLLSTAWM